MKESGIVIPQNASEDELTAAAYAMTGISANAALFMKNMDAAVFGESDDINKKYILYISGYDNLNPEIVSKMSGGAKGGSGEREQSLSFLQDRAERNYLLITGRDSQALIECPPAAGVKTYMQQIAAREKASVQRTMLFSVMMRRRKVFLQKPEAM